MRFPGIAYQTYERLKSNPLYLGITDFVLRTLRFEKNPIKRARIAHEIVEDYTKEVSSNPLVAEFSGCKRGCSLCCHTEVSVTPDEAELLALRVEQGIKIDWSKLHIQKTHLENNKSYYTLPFELRGCVFLGDENQCRVYEDRPSVCRTNMVIGDNSQCSTVDGNVRPTRLVKTEKADMVTMGQFMLTPNDNDLLPALVWKKLGAKKQSKKSEIKSSYKIFKDKSL